MPQFQGILDYLKSTTLFENDDDYKGGEEAIGLAGQTPLDGLYVPGLALQVLYHE